MGAGDVISLLFSLALMVFVLYLCYKFSKYMAKRVNMASGSDNIKIIERTALGQDKGLAVVLICGKYYLIGYANNDIEILKELDNYTPPSIEDVSLTGNGNLISKFINDNKKFYSELKNSVSSKNNRKNTNIEFSEILNQKSKKTNTDEAENDDQHK